MIPDNNRKNKKKKNPEESLVSIEIDPLFFERVNKLKKDAPIKGKSPSASLPNPPPTPEPTPTPTPTNTITWTPPPSPTPPPFTTPTPTPTSTPSPTNTDTPTGPISIESEDALSLSVEQEIDVVSVIDEENPFGEKTFAEIVIDASLSEIKDRKDINTEQISNSVEQNVSFAEIRFSEKTINQSIFTDVNWNVSLKELIFGELPINEVASMGISNTIAFSELSQIEFSPIAYETFVSIDTEVQLAELALVAFSFSEEAQIGIDTEIFIKQLADVSFLFSEDSEISVKTEAKFAEIVSEVGGTGSPLDVGEFIGSGVGTEVVISGVTPTLAGNSFLFYAPVGSSGTNGLLDYVSINSSGTLICRIHDPVAMSYNVVSLQDFIDNRLATSDRILTYTHDICFLKTFYTFNLNFPQGIGQTSTTIGAFFAHKTSFGTVESIVDSNTNVYGVFPTNGTTNELSGTSVVPIVYNGTPYIVYRLLSQNPSTTISVQINNCV